MKIRDPKGAFWTIEEKPKEKPAVDVGGLLKELTSAVAGLGDALNKPPPHVVVNVPDRPKQWLFRVERDAQGNINTIKADAIGG